MKNAKVFTDWEEAWDILQSKLQKIADGHASMDECTEASKFVYQLASQPSPYNWSANLYQRFEEIIRNQGQTHPDTYNERCCRVQKLFRYIDRYHVKHNNLPPTKSLIGTNMP